MKQCNECKEFKELSEFSKQKGAKDGYINQCKPCKRIKNREYNKNNKYKNSLKNKKYDKNNKDKIRNRVLEKKYNITLDQYKQMLVSQNGVCAICGKPETKTHHISNKIKDLAVDHNHQTGEVRQLLCCECNLAVGNLKESIEYSIKLTQYLVKWSKNVV